MIYFVGFYFGLVIFYVSHRFITMPSEWVRWRLKSPSLRLFIWPFIKGPITEKHQSSASLAIVWGIHRWPVNSVHKGTVTRIMFPFDDVIMSARFRLSLVLGSSYDCSEASEVSLNNYKIERKTKYKKGCIYRDVLHIQYKPKSQY